MQHALAALSLLALSGGASAYVPVSGAFAPTARTVPAAPARGLAPRLAVPPRVRALNAGLRHAKGVASAEKNAPTAMDWDTLTDFQWGSVETDFMTIAKFSPETGNKWAEAEVLPYGPVPTSPRAAIFNYGQGLFEGMKAQRTKEGKIVIFRPDRNAKRAAYGCERLMMPPVPEDIFVKAVKDFVLANAAWVPPFGQGTLYIRPLIMGSGPILALAPPAEYTFMIYGSPVGSYFKGNQLTPIKLKLETGYTRAAPGGVGGVKAVGNYVPSLKPQKEAKEDGFDNVIFLDSETGTYIEEVSTSNVFVVKDKVVYTPGVVGGGSPDDTILEGVTRDCLITLCKDKGYELREEKVPVETMMTADEAFTVGTAVVISPIGEAVHEGKTHTLLGDKGPITQDLYQTLVDIQTGAGEDKHGWTIFLD